MNINALYFIFSICFISLQAQSQTIFEVWDIPEEGCSLDKSNMPNAIQRYGVEDSPPPPPPARNGEETINELLSKLATHFEELAEKDPYLSVPMIKWKSGSQFFKQNGLWGLQSEDEEISIEPRFEYILSHKSWEGFVGYNDGQCNYYNLKGEPQFKQSFYHIKPVLEGVFIVRTKEGFGLIDREEEVLLPTNNQEVKLLKKEGEPYFFIKTADYNYLLSGDTKHRVYYSTNQHEWRFLDDRYAYLSSQGVLIDLQEKKQLFCGEDIFVHVLDWKQKVLKIYRRHQKEISYIVHLDGHLISSQPWQTIQNYYPEGYAVVGRPAPQKPNQRPSSLYGLIDSTGKIILPLEYQRLPHQMIGGKYLQIRNSANQSTLINLSGEVLFEYGPYEYFSVNESEQTISMSWKEGQVRKRSSFNVATGELKSLEPLKYWSLKSHVNDDNDTVYVAKTNKGEMLLNAAHEPLLSSPVSRIFKGLEPNTFMTYSSSYTNGHRRVNRQWIDFSGKAHVFKIEGQRVDSFYNLFKLREGFFYIQTDEEAGYFSTLKKATTASNYAWREKSASLGSSHILDAAGFGGYGIVDKKGELIVSPNFKSIWFDRSSSLLFVQLDDNNKRCFTPTGDALFDGVYPWVEKMKPGLIKVKKNGKFGLLKPSGEVILPTEFVYLWFRDGLINGRRTKRGGIEQYDLAGRRL